MCLIQTAVHCVIILSVKYLCTVTVKSVQTPWAYDKPQLFSLWPISTQSYHNSKSAQFPLQYHKMLEIFILIKLKKNLLIWKKEKRRKKIPKKYGCLLIKKRRGLVELELFLIPFHCSLSQTTIDLP